MLRRIIAGPLGILLVALLLFEAYLQSFGFCAEHRTMPIEKYGVRTSLRWQDIVFLTVVWTVLLGLFYVLYRLLKWVCNNSTRFFLTVATLSLVAIAAWQARTWPGQSVRSELIRLHDQSGLSLTSLRDNNIYTVSFPNRSLNPPVPIPSKGTVMSGNFSEDGRKVAVVFCKEPGLTHPEPYVTDCPSGIVLAIMTPDGSNIHQYEYMANPGSMTCWSHDGSKLVLSAEDRRKGKYAPFELQIFDLNTEKTKLIADGSEAIIDPQCWSPDDRQVVYTVSLMALHPRVYQN